MLFFDGAQIKGAALTEPTCCVMKERRVLIVHQSCAQNTKLCPSLTSLPILGLSGGYWAESGPAKMAAPEQLTLHFRNLWLMPWSLRPSVHTLRVVMIDCRWVCHCGNPFSINM